MDEFIFPLAFDGASEGPAPRLDEADSISGVNYARALDAVPPFAASGSVVLDGSEGNTYDDWYDWMEAHGWGAAVVYYRARSLAKHYRVRDYALGTAAGGAGQSFALFHRDIDEDTIEVRVAGAVQAAARWSISGNGTAPMLDTLANFAAGEVTISYQFLHRCRVKQTGMALVRVDRDGEPASVRPAVQIMEVEAGGHRA